MLLSPLPQLPPSLPRFPAMPCSHRLLSTLDTLRILPEVRSLILWSNGDITGRTTFPEFARKHSRRGGAVSLERRLERKGDADPNGKKGNHHRGGAGRIDGGIGVSQAFGHCSRNSRGEQRDRRHLAHDSLQGQPDGHW